MQPVLFVYTNFVKRYEVVFTNLKICAIIVTAAGQMINAVRGSELYGGL